MDVYTATGKVVLKAEGRVVYEATGEIIIEAVLPVGAQVLLTKGQTGTSIEVTAKDGDGDAVNFTGCTAVVFTMEHYRDKTKKIDAKTAEFATDKTSGVLRYWPATADVDTVGEYRGQFKVTDASAKYIFVPSDSRELIEVIVGRPAGG